jgi:hypothetical protein
MKPANETPVTKSKFTKLTEKFNLLTLEDKGEFLDLATELYDNDLTKEKERLNSQVADLENKQSKLKK